MAMAMCRPVLYALSGVVLFRTTKDHYHVPKLLHRGAGNSKAKQIKTNPDIYTQN